MTHPPSNHASHPPRFATCRLLAALLATAFLCAPSRAEPPPEFLSVRDGLAFVATSNAVDVLDIRAPEGIEPFATIPLRGKPSGAPAFHVDTALFPHGNGVSLIDLILPEAPRIIRDFCATPGERTARRVQVAGSVLLVEGDDGIRVFDASDPYAPAYRFFLEGKGSYGPSFAASDSLLPVFTEDRCRIYEITPDALLPRGLATISSNSACVFLAATVLLETSRSLSRIHDLTNPDEPTAKSFTNAVLRPLDMPVRRNRLWTYRENSIEEWNVSDPHAPRRIRSIALPTPGLARHAWVEGSTCLCSENGVLHAFLLSGTTAKPLGLKHPGKNATATNATPVAATNASSVAVTNAPPVAVTNATPPAATNATPPVATNASPVAATNAPPSATRAYRVRAPESTLGSDPFPPFLHSASFALHRHFLYFTWPPAVTAARGIVAVDVQDPKSPRGLGFAPIGGYPIALAAPPGRNLLFCANGTHLLAYEIQRKGTLRSAGSLLVADDPVGGPQALAWAGEGRLLIACGAAGVAVVDVRDPRAMAVVSALPADGYVRDIAFDGRQVWVANDTAGATAFALKGFDLLPFGDIVLPRGGASALALSPSNAVLAACGDVPVAALDVRHNAPGLASLCERGDVFASDIAVFSTPAAPGRSFAAIVGDGLAFYDVTDTSAPVPLPRKADAASTGPFHAVLANGPVLYLLSPRGLSIFDATDPAEPRALSTLDIQ